MKFLTLFSKITKIFFVNRGDLNHLTTLKGNYVSVET